MFFIFQQTSNIIAQKKFNPARDPCSVLWDVLWDDLVTMELTHGKNDQQNAPPSRLVLYLQSRSTESKEIIRVIKCYRESNQAFEVYSSIEQAMSTNGPSQSKVGGAMFFMFQSCVLLSAEVWYLIEAPSECYIAS